MAASETKTPVQRATMFTAKQLAWCLALQVVLVGGGVSWASWRAIDLHHERALPPLREVPLSVGALYDYPVVVSDDQLAMVMEKLRPRELGAKTKINHVDHALRYWGAEVDFNDPQRISGPPMRELITDHRRFVERFGSDVPSLLMDGPLGVRVRVQEGPSTSSHVDHTVAGLAEVGTPLDYPIVTPTHESNYQAMLQQMLADFSLNQIEYEWSALAMALTLPPVTEWVTSEGQRISFDMLARRMMREELPLGVCFGNHRLFTLAVFLRVDDQTPILSPAVRAEVMDYLAGVTELLVRTQHVEGYWDGNWPSGVSPEAASGVTSGDTMADRILATGHALEWWAIAPAELHPPRHVLASAGQWLARTVENLTERQTEEYYTYLSHVGRALALWRHRAPREVLGL